MSESQEQDGSGIIPAVLAVYGTYLAYRAAHGSIPGSWQEVAVALQIQKTLGDALAMIAARALSRQREGLGAGADELWAALPQGVQAGIDAGIKTVAEAMIWTDGHAEQTTKDVESGLIPTAANPPVELAMVTAQAVASAAELATAEAAGWRYKIWNTMKDPRVRQTHRDLAGVKISLNEVFKTIDGDELQFPGDPSSDITNRIGCRCWLTTAR
jgi:hypothetical protein